MEKTWGGGIGSGGWEVGNLFLKTKNIRRKHIPPAKGQSPGRGQLGVPGPSGDTEA